MVIIESGVAKKPSPVLLSNVLVILATRLYLKIIRFTLLISICCRSHSIIDRKKKNNSKIGKYHLQKFKNSEIKYFSCSPYFFAFSACTCMCLKGQCISSVFPARKQACILFWLNKFWNVNSKYFNRLNVYRKRKKLLKVRIMEDSKPIMEI